ncbi:ATP SYNTHASE GAMMA CHAIN [Salix purpurea]|uniref:F-ATPase gamma subunit n=1 Tax=Salix purpurea TaxID=77065 RepID=A0A9Q0WLK9_SALPP|nr:ATP SYNTHASE GAMMA CHAIN [Salix purpurea]
MGGLSLRLLLKFFITSMNSFTDDIDIPSTKVRPVKKVALVVTDDRGLCGPYIPVVRFIEGTGLPTAKEALAIANNVFSLFVSEDVDIVELLYTKFVTSEDEFFRLTTKDGKLTVERGVTRTETSDFSPILQFEQNQVQILDALDVFVVAS